MVEHQENANKVLIVDDQYGIRVLLTEILQAHGYELYEAANDEQALAGVRENLPDLVLLDMKMPGTSGMDILKQIKDEAPETKVIIMTAFEDQGLVGEAFELGALDYFEKPFDIDDVCDVIRQELPLFSIR